jgi:hypothetical protein
MRLEKWCKIDDRYSVSDFGRVKSIGISYSTVSNILAKRSWGYL